MNVPKLRFKEFNDEYIEKKLSEIVQKKGGGTPNTAKITYWQGTIPWISSSDLSSENILSININRYISQEALKKSATNLIPKNSVLIVTRVGVGKVATNKIDICTSQDFTNLINFSGNSCYLAYILKRKMEKFQKTTQGTSIKGITSKELMNLDLNIPSLNEQIKVAKFLILLDKKIELQTKKIEDLKLFKLGIKNRMFENGGNKLKLKDILSKWKEKNKNGTIKYIESINNKHGFISQLDQFEDRSVASKDLKNYYIIRKNVFGYNPSRLNVGSLALKENDTVSVVSPLYECFTTNQNNKFLLEWFDSKYFRRGASSKFEGGVRNTLNFSNLCEIEINLPSLEKQDKYASILSSFDKKICLEDERLNKLNNLKKGLLQKMFV